MEAWGTKTKNHKKIIVVGLAARLRRHGQQKHVFHQTMHLLSLVPHNSQKHLTNKPIRNSSEARIMLHIFLYLNQNRKTLQLKKTWAPCRRLSLTKNCDLTTHRLLGFSKRRRKRDSDRTCDWMTLSGTRTCALCSALMHRALRSRQETPMSLIFGAP